MNSRSLTRQLLALSCALLFAAPAVSRAARSESVSESKYESQSIRSHLNFSWNSTLSPFLPFSFFGLSTTLKHGRTFGTVSAVVYDAPPGTYTVSASVSGSESFALGTFMVTGTTVYYRSASGALLIQSTPGVGEASFGVKKALLPKGTNPSDITFVSVSDSNGNVLTSGTFPAGEFWNDQLNALSPLAAGDAAPSATGWALLRFDGTVYLTPGAVASAVTPLVSGTIILSGSLPMGIWPPPPPEGGQLMIHAHGLPPSTPVTYALDKTDIATVDTSSSGDLFLDVRQPGFNATGPIPASINFFITKKLTIRDASSGKVLTSASF